MAYKIVAVVKRKEGLSREEFLRSWHEEHPRFVSRLPGIRRYRQNPAISHRDKVWPFDGIAELWFDSVADVARAYSGPEAEALFEHEHHYIEDMQWILAEEVEVDLDAVQGEGA